MKLNFLGRGAAFNPEEGNTSAYFVEDKQLFLIDCGEGIFERLKKNGLLDNVEAVNLMITHTYSDHIGSLGTLAMYCYFALHRPLNIVVPSEAKHLSDIEKILSGFACTPEMYNYVDCGYYDNKFTSFQNIRYMETEHDTNLASYGLLFNTLDGLVYYSGDTNDLKNVKALIGTGQNIDKLYMDTTSANYPGNVHLYVGILQEQIPDNLKSKVYCMHFNNAECIEMARNMGFNVVEVKDIKERTFNR